MSRVFTRDWPDWSLLPRLLQNQVWIWRLHLVAWPESSQDWSLLSIAEQERARRYRRQEDRHRFVLTRSWLRRLLAAYLNQDPRRLEFQTSAQGKPFLLGESLWFNVSHSGDWAVLAVSRDRPLGIDLECHRSVSVLGLAQRFFQASELASLQGVAPESQQRLFFDYWTAKEAYLKATGEGLGALSRVEIDCASILGDRLPLWRCCTESKSTLGRDRRTPTFEAQRLLFEPGYSAALVVGHWGCDGLTEQSFVPNVTKRNNKSVFLRIYYGTISPKMRLLA